MGSGSITLPTRYKVITIVAAFSSVYTNVHTFNMCATDTGDRIIFSSGWSTDSSFIRTRIFNFYNGVIVSYNGGYIQYPDSGNGDNVGIIPKYIYGLII